MNEIILGDCLLEMRKIKSNSIDLICTDPPYGISFMGKDWDKAVPSVEIWRECRRILKSGAFAFIMSGPRQDCLMTMIKNLKEAGFETGFSSIYWTYGTGFPKASKISKLIDMKFGSYIEGKPSINARYSKKETEKGSYSHSKITREFEPHSDKAKELDGSYGGFQPKPAVELILVVMKPLSKEGYSEQSIANKKGVTWLDDGRIPYQSDNDVWKESIRGDPVCVSYGSNKELSSPNKKGRFPANLLISDNILDTGQIHKGNYCPKPSDCQGSQTWGTLQINRGPRGYDDEGDFSRYFSLDAWFQDKIKTLPDEAQKTFPFLYCPKPTRSEKEKGLDDFPQKKVRGDYSDQSQLGILEKVQNSPRPKGKNFHPTCKPLKLMSWLIAIGSREGDIVLDPFAGSGSTLIAAKALKRNYIGFEIEKEYLEIAQARLEIAMEFPTEEWIPPNKKQQFNIVDEGW